MRKEWKIPPSLELVNGVYCVSQNMDESVGESIALNSLKNTIRHSHKMFRKSHGCQYLNLDVAGRNNP